MISTYEYLKDIPFLKQVARSHIQTYYVKINTLNWKQQLLKAIEGRVISGSINIDGKSSVRRTLNLSVYVTDYFNDITDAKNLLSINKKIEIEIGIKNIFQKYTDYDTLWFPQGVYIISSCSIAYDSGGMTVSVQAKDKMCLLDGECGGTFPATTQLDIYHVINEQGEDSVERPLLYRIIQELVNHFGGEQLGKIIISDVDPLVKYVVKWTNKSPLYILASQGDAQFLCTTDYNEVSRALNKAKWNLSKDRIINYGQDVGYKYTDFTYPAPQDTEDVSNFVCQAGSTVTQALDKIINEVLGNYEYFYDVYGNFIFREIKNYLNNSQSKYISEYLTREQNDNNYYKELLPDYINKEGASPYLYDIDKGTGIVSFANDNDLIISYNNSPQYNSIKNDIIVWGMRKGLGNEGYPIRYHLAIDKKPKITTSDENGNEIPLTYRAFKIEENGKQVWYATIPSITVKLPKPGTQGLYWEVLDDKDDDSGKPVVKTWDVDLQEYKKVENITLQDIVVQDWRTALFFQGTVAEPFGVDSNYYYAELKQEWPKIYDIENGQFRESTILYPQEINYYLDFIDTDSYLAQLSVNNIGRRTKVFNEKNNVNCIFEPNIEDIVFIRTEKTTSATGNEEVINNSINESFETNTERIKDFCQQQGQRYYQLDSDIYDNFTLGGKLNSAYEVARQSLQEYTGYNESITIQCLPLYFLQPNERITLFNTESDISGDYIIDTMNYSFDVSSTLTINATKVLDKI